MLAAPTPTLSRAFVEYYKNKSSLSFLSNISLGKSSQNDIATCG